MDKSKVLIIKTGYSEILEDRNNSRKVSLGDILRTTPLLQNYKTSRVTWVADEGAFPLLEGNPLIQRVLPYDFTTALQLESEEFDTVINLEKIPGICALAARINARRNRFGFTFNTQTGEAEAYDHALDVLAVSADPKLKKGNKRTFQKLLFEMVNSKWKGEPYSLGYRPKISKEFEVALNTQIGQKWPTKSWSKEHWDGLEDMLKLRGVRVTRQDRQPKEVLSNLYHYMDWINSAELIVSNDSLGLHLGIALRKDVVGLFGPTPYKEVYFYGKGEAIYPKRRDCMPCFRGVCSEGGGCMGEIKPERVFKKVMGYLK
jgi:heptosyltransferase II